MSNSTDSDAVEEFYANLSDLNRRIAVPGPSFPGHDRPRDPKHRAPEDLVDFSTFRSGEPLTDLQRETMESRLAQLRDLLKMHREEPNHSRSLTHNNPRERATAERSLLTLISEAEKRLTT